MPGIFGQYGLALAWLNGFLFLPFWMKRALPLFFVCLLCWTISACDSTDNSDDTHTSTSEKTTVPSTYLPKTDSLEKVYDVSYTLDFDLIDDPGTLLLTIKYLDLIEEKYVEANAVVNNAAVLLYDANPDLFDHFDRVAVKILTDKNSAAEKSVAIQFSQENLERFQNRRQLAAQFLREWTDCLHTQAPENCTDYFIAEEEAIPDLIKVYKEMQDLFPPDYSETFITGLRISSVEESGVEFYDLDAVLDSPKAQRLFYCAIQRKEGEMKMIELGY